MLADRVTDVRAELGEGPVWDDRQGMLRWVDITAGVVHRLEVATGEHASVSVGLPVSALALRADGIIVAAQDGFALVDEGAHEVRLVGPVEPDDRSTRMNDGKCDAAGRFWAGSMAFDFAAGRGSLWCLEPDGAHTVRRVLDGLTLSNGLAWSPDDRTLYFIDSTTYRVDAIDFDLDTGTLGARRPFVTVDRGLGMPDGMAMDVDGCFWVALFGGSGVCRFTPRGALDRMVEVPATNVTSCTFGGSALDELYITTAAEGLDARARREQPHAGGLFAVDAGVSGMAPARFGA